METSPFVRIFSILRLTPYFFNKTMRESIEDAPVVYCKWNSADEDDLANLKSKKIDIGDTALGRLRDTHKRELDAAYKPMSPRSKADTIKGFKQ